MIDVPCPYSYRPYPPATPPKQDNNSTEHKSPNKGNNIMLDKAISIASQAFEGKYDKGGQPYILHCLYVMNQMPENDHELRCVAVLHDIVEDTDWTLLDLREEGFSVTVVDAVELLTKKNGQSYDDYIKEVKQNDLARQVKLADLKHNSDITRMKGIEIKDMARLEKYFKAYKYLMDY